MFINDEGTTIGYRKSKEIEPIKRLEKNKSLDLIHDVHGYAMDFIKDVKDRIDENETVEINSMVWFAPFCTFALYPNKETYEFYKKFSFINGAMEYGIVPSKNLMYYFIHPIKCIKEFEYNNAKVIWLYGLLKIPLPYFRILCFLTDSLGLKTAYEKKYLRKRIK